MKKLAVIQLDVACHYLNSLGFYISCGRNTEENRWDGFMSQSWIGANHFHTYFLSWHTVIWLNLTAKEPEILLEEKWGPLKKYCFSLKWAKIEFSQLKNFCESLLLRLYHFRSGYSCNITIGLHVATHFSTSIQCGL